MSTLFTDSDQLFDTQQTSQELAGAAFAILSEDGISVMRPEGQFSNAATGNSEQVNQYDSPDSEFSQDQETGKWVTPREHEEVSTKHAATIKLHQVKVHINYLLDLWEKSGDLSKKPESLKDLTTLLGDCDEMMKIINEGDSENTKLGVAEAGVLNDISTDVDISYADVFGEIIGQSKKAAARIGNIPDMKGLDDSLKELMRQNFGDKNQEELDKIMHALEGTKEYHRIVAALKTAAWNVAGEAGRLIWAEGLERLEEWMSTALKEFKSHGDYVISFVTGLFDIFGTDPSDPVSDMRKTFDLINVLIDNPFAKTLVPLWTAYRPAINFCMNGIEEIQNRQKESERNLGIAQGLKKYVSHNQPDKINEFMTRGFPGVSKLGKKQLLLFMMKMHTLSYKEAHNVPVDGAVLTFFEVNIDLIIARDKERIRTDYNNVLNPWDNELKDIASSAYIHRDMIWSMLYGSLLTPPQ